MLPTINTPRINAPYLPGVQGVNLPAIAPPSIGAFYSSFDNSQLKLKQSDVQDQLKSLSDIIFNDLAKEKAAERYDTAFEYVPILRELELVPHYFKENFIDAGPMGSIMNTLGAMRQDTKMLTGAHFVRGIWQGESFEDMIGSGDRGLVRTDWDIDTGSKVADFFGNMVLESITDPATVLTKAFEVDVKFKAEEAAEELTKRLVEEHSLKLGEGVTKNITSSLSKINKGWTDKAQTNIVNQIEGIVRQHGASLSDGAVAEIVKDVTEEMVTNRSFGLLEVSLNQAHEWHKTQVAIRDMASAVTPWGVMRWGYKNVWDPVANSVARSVADKSEAYKDTSFLALEETRKNIKTVTQQEIIDKIGFEKHNVILETWDLNRDKVLEEFAQAEKDVIGILKNQEKAVGYASKSVKERVIRRFITRLSNNKHLTEGDRVALHELAETLVEASEEGFYIDTYEKLEDFISKQIDIGYKSSPQHLRYVKNMVGTFGASKHKDAMKLVEDLIKESSARNFANVQITEGMMDEVYKRLSGNLPEDAPIGDVLLNLLDSTDSEYFSEALEKLEEMDTEGNLIKEALKKMTKGLTEKYDETIIDNYVERYRLEHVLKGLGDTKVIGTAIESGLEEDLIEDVYATIDLLDDKMDLEAELERVKRISQDDNLNRLLRSEAVLDTENILTEVKESTTTERFNIPFLQDEIDNTEVTNYMRYTTQGRTYNPYKLDMSEEAYQKAVNFVSTSDVPVYNPFYGMTYEQWKDFLDKNPQAAYEHWETLNRYKNIPKPANFHEWLDWQNKTHKSAAEFTRQIGKNSYIPSNVAKHKEFLKKFDEQYKTFEDFFLTEDFHIENILEAAGITDTLSEDYQNFVTSFLIYAEDPDNFEQFVLMSSAAEELRSSVNAFPEGHVEKEVLKDFLDEVINEHVTGKESLKVKDMLALERELSVDSVTDLFREEYYVETLAARVRNYMIINQLSNSEYFPTISALATEGSDVRNFVEVLGNIFYANEYGDMGDSLFDIVKSSTSFINQKEFMESLSSLNPEGLLDILDQLFPEQAEDLLMFHASHSDTFKRLLIDTIADSRFTYTSALDALNTSEVSKRFTEKLIDFIKPVTEEELLNVEALSEVYTRSFLNPYLRQQAGINAKVSQLFDRKSIRAMEKLEEGYHMLEDVLEKDSRNEILAGYAELVNTVTGINPIPAEDRVIMQLANFDAADSAKATGLFMEVRSILHSIEQFNQDATTVGQLIGRQELDDNAFILNLSGETGGKVLKRINKIPKDGGLDPQKFLDVHPLDFMKMNSDLHASEQWATRKVSQGHFQDWAIALRRRYVETALEQYPDIFEKYVKKAETIEQLSFFEDAKEIFEESLTDVEVLKYHKFFSGKEDLPTYQKIIKEVNESRTPESILAARLEETDPRHFMRRALNIRDESNYVSNTELEYAANSMPIYTYWAELENAADVMGNNPFVSLDEADRSRALLSAGIQQDSFSMHNLIKDFQELESKYDVQDYAHISYQSKVAEFRAFTTLTPEQQADWIMSWSKGAIIWDTDLDEGVSKLDIEALKKQGFATQYIERDRMVIYNTSKERLEKEIKRIHLKVGDMETDGELYKDIQKANEKVLPYIGKENLPFSGTLNVPNYRNSKEWENIITKLEGAELPKDFRQTIEYGDFRIPHGNYLTRTAGAWQGHIRNANAKTKYLQMFASDIFKADAGMHSAILDDMNDTEIKEWFKDQNMTGAMIVADKRDVARGPRVIRYPIDSRDALESARKTGAMIIPNETYSMMFRSVNTNHLPKFVQAIQDTYFRLMKMNYLSNWGTTARNEMDITYKNAVSAGLFGNNGDAVQRQMQAYKALEFRENVLQETLEEFGDLKRQSVEKTLSKYSPELRLMYFMTESFKESPASEGLGKVMEDYMLSFVDEPEDALKALSQKLGDLGANNVHTKPIFEWSSLAEDTGRFANYMESLFQTGESGKGIASAVAAHFDYSTKAPAENMAELIFSFVTFPLRNLSFYVEHYADSPQALDQLLDSWHHSWANEDLDLDNKYESWLVNMAAGGNLKLGDYIVKTGPSFFDALALTMDPVGEMRQRLTAPIQSALNIGNKDFDHFSNLMPYWSPVKRDVIAASHAARGDFRPEKVLPFLVAKDSRQNYRGRYIKPKAIWTKYPKVNRNYVRNPARHRNFATRYGSRNFYRELYPTGRSDQGKVHLAQNTASYWADPDKIVSNVNRIQWMFR